MTLTFTVLVAPVSQQHGSRATAFKGKLRWYVDSSKKKFFNEVLRESKHLMPVKPLQGPVQMQMTFFIERPDVKSSKFRMLPQTVKAQLLTNKSAIPAWSNASNKSDVGNLAKGSLDALVKAGLMVNDAQVWHEDNSMYFTEEDLPPRIVVTVQHEDSYAP